MGNFKKRKANKTGNSSKKSGTDGKKPSQSNKYGIQFSISNAAAYEKMKTKIIEHLADIVKEDTSTLKNAIMTGTDLEDHYKANPIPNYASEIAKDIVNLPKDNDGNISLGEKAAHEERLAEARLRKSNEEKKRATRLDKYHDNLDKLFSFVWQACSNELQERIKKHEGYKTKIMNNGLQLLKVIPYYSKFDDEVVYLPSKIYQAMQDLVNLRQYIDEEPSDYQERVQTTAETFVAVTGMKIPFPKLILMNREKEQATAQPGGGGASATHTVKEGDVLSSEQLKSVTDKDIEESWEQFLSYIMIKKAHRSRHNELQAQMEQDHGRGLKNYPTTLVDSTQMLKTFQLKDHELKKVIEKTSQDKKSNSNAKASLDSGTETYLAAMNQVGDVCWCCGKPNHKANKCWERNKIKKADWWCNKNKVPSLLQHVYLMYKKDANKFSDAVSLFQRSSDADSTTGSTASETASISTSSQEQPAPVTSRALVPYNNQFNIVGGQMSMFTGVGLQDLVILSCFLEQTLR